MWWEPLFLVIVAMSIYLPLRDQQRAILKRLDRIEEKISDLWAEHRQKQLSAELDAALTKGREITERLGREGFYSFDEDGKEHWHPPGSQLPK